MLYFCNFSQLKIRIIQANNNDTITIFGQIIKRQYDATAWKAVFDSSMVCVINIIKNDIQAHRVLHTDQNDVWIYAMPINTTTLALYDKNFCLQRNT